MYSEKRLFTRRGKVFGLTFEVVTIDHTNDGGFLDSARLAFTRPLLHSTTAEAISNIRDESKRLPAATVIGHGKPGLIVAGTGKDFISAKQGISAHKASSLDPLKDLRGRVASLDLLGCDVGAEQIGAQLLHCIALKVDAETSAPTGLLWSFGGRMWLEPGATIQTATPEHFPSQILPPTAPLDPQPAFLVLGMPQPDQYISIPMDSLRSAQLTWQSSDDRQAGSRILSLEQSKSLLGLVSFSKPIVTSAFPATIVTGELILVFDVEGVVMTRKFTIHSERLLQSEESPKMYYRTGADFQQALTQLMQ